MANGFEKTAQMIKSQQKDNGEMCLCEIKKVSSDGKKVFEIEINSQSYSLGAFSFVKPYDHQFSIGDLYICFIEDKTIYLLMRSEVMQ